MNHFEKIKMKITKGFLCNGIFCGFSNSFQIINWEGIRDMVLLVSHLKWEHVFIYSVIEIIGGDRGEMVCVTSISFSVFPSF